MPKIYYKYFTFLFMALLLFFLNSSFALALEIKNYPPMPGIGTPKDCAPKECLGQYVAYWFGVGVYLAGALAAIFLAVGALRLMTSAGNPSAHKEAVDIIKGAILGMVLIVVAFLILTTINPKLVEPSLTPLPPVDGIFYIKGDDRLPAPMSEANISNVPEGYEKLLYACSSGPALFVWKFPKINFQGNDAIYSGTYVVRKTCGQTEDLKGIGSFQMAFETTGAYYCMGGCSETGTICSGLMSGANTASGQIPEPFKNNVKSVLFVNDPARGLQYGAIFLDVDDPTNAGNCSLVYNVGDKVTDRICYNHDSKPSSSVSVFAWNYKTPETSGAGVDFHSEPWGQAMGARAGTYFLNKDKIKNYFSDFANKMPFDYFWVKRPNEYIRLYQNFQQHPGSIYLHGNYLVKIKGGYKDPATPCQIFYNTVNNIKETEFIATGNKIDSVVIIPVK